MDSLPEPLTSAEHQALIAIVRREAPDLLPLVHRVLNRRWLADDEAEALDRVLMGAFLSSLDEDQEPDARGAEVSRLCQRIQEQRESFWQ